MSARGTPVSNGIAGAMVLPAIAIVVVLSCGALGLSTLWPMLNAIWSNIYGAFSHGYLVLALCAWLGVRAWRRAPPVRLRARWIAGLALLLLVLALIAMEIMFLNSSRLVLLPLMFVTVVAFVFGMDAAKTLFLPSMFLLLALPQWWVINGVLQRFTRMVVSSAVTLTGLPAYVEGNFIHVPAGVFEIASGCSGLSYLIAALSLSCFYGLMYLSRWKSRIILASAAAAMAMMSNFARVYALVVIGIASDMQHYLIRVEHLYFGWALFMLTMLPVLWLARRLEAAEAAAVAESDPMPVRHTSAPFVSAGVVAAAIVAGLILLLPRFVSAPQASASFEVLRLPAAIDSWSRDDLQHLEWSPAFLNAHEELARYVSGTSAVEVYVAGYAHQSSERRLIRKENDFYGSGWRLAEQNVRSLGRQDAEFRVLESRGYRQGRERLVWSWYVVAGRTAVGEFAAKLAEVTGLLQGRRDAAAIAITTECVPNCAAARSRLSNFMQGAAVYVLPPELALR